MRARLFFSVSLSGSAIAILAGCGGNGTASGTKATPAAVKTLVQQSLPKSGKIPTPAATATTIPASDFTAVVAGVVSDHKTHAPVSGATIIVGNHLRTARTDATGHYRISFPAHASVVVIAQKSGYAGVLAIGKLPTKGSTTLNLAMTKNQPGVLPAPPPPMQFGSK